MILGNCHQFSMILTNSQWFSLILDDSQILYTNDACGLFCVWMKNELQIHKSHYQTMPTYYIIVPWCHISFVHQIPACDSYAVTMHVAPSVSASIIKFKEMKQSHLNKNWNTSFEIFFSNFHNSFDPIVIIQCDILFSWCGNDMPSSFKYAVIMWYTLCNICCSFDVYM